MTMSPHPQQTPPFNCNHVKATVESLRGSMEKLSPRESFAAEGLPKENPEGALTLPRSTVSALEALS